MRIAVPLSLGTFSPHFGGAEDFAFYTINAVDRSIGERVLGAPPEHGRGVYPVWLRQQGATVVLAGGMGPRAVGIFAKNGIEVVLGIQGDDPDVLVRNYLDGTLEATGEPCHEHGFHDCGDDHGEGGRGGCRDS